LDVWSAKEESETTPEKPPKLVKVTVEPPKVPGQILSVGFAEMPKSGSLILASTKSVLLSSLCLYSTAISTEPFVAPKLVPIFIKYASPVEMFLTVRRVSCPLLPTSNVRSSHWLSSIP